MKTFIAFLFLILWGSLSAGKSLEKLGLTPQRLGKIAGEVSDLIYEIHQARKLMAAQNVIVATYGGTSREIINYVIEGIKQKGSVDEFENEITSRKRKGLWISLFQIHRIASDLDILLFKRKGNISLQNSNEYAKLIESEFPGSTFYKKLDVHSSDRFFSEFPMELNHMETISNIPLSEHGVEHLRELQFPIDGKTTDLAMHGLSQFVHGELEFRICEKFDSDPHYRDREFFRHFLSLLRWLRYRAESPDMGLSPTSKAHITKLLKFLYEEKVPQITELLVRGHQELRTKDRGDSFGAKLIAELEKLQIYGRNPEMTHQWLHEKYDIGNNLSVSIADFVSEAGISGERLLEPLSNQSSAKPLRTENPGKRLEKPLRLFHRSSLRAVQSISLGALWASNNKSIILGHTTGSALANAGLYASTETGAVEYGDFYVPIVLREGAVEGLDFVHEDNYYCIVNQNAIKSVEQIDLEKIKSHLVDTIFQTLPKDKNDLMTSIRTLAAILNPRDQREINLFNRILRQIQSLAMAGLESVFWESFLDRKSNRDFIFGNNAPLTNALMQQEFKSRMMSPEFGMVRGRLVKNLDLSHKADVAILKQLFQMMQVSDLAERNKFNLVWFHLLSKKENYQWLQSNDKIAKSIYSFLRNYLMGSQLTKKNLEPLVPRKEQQLGKRSPMEELEQTISDLDNHLARGNGGTSFRRSKLLRQFLGPDVKNADPIKWLSLFLQTSAKDGHYRAYFKINLDHPVDIALMELTQMEPSLRKTEFLQYGGDYDIYTIPTYIVHKILNLARQGNWGIQNLPLANKLLALAYGEPMSTQGVTDGPDIGLPPDFKPSSFRSVFFKLIENLDLSRETDQSLVKQLFQLMQVSDGTERTKMNLAWFNLLSKKRNFDWLRSKDPVAERIHAFLKDTLGQETQKLTSTEIKELEFSWKGGKQQKSSPQAQLKKALSDLGRHLARGGEFYHFDKERLSKLTSDARLKAADPLGWLAMLFQVRENDPYYHYSLLYTFNLNSNLDVVMIKAAEREPLLADLFPGDIKMSRILLFSSRPDDYEKIFGPLQDKKVEFSFYWKAGNHRPKAALYQSWIDMPLTELIDKMIHRQPILPPEEKVLRYFIRNEEPVHWLGEPTEEQEAWSLSTYLLENSLEGKELVLDEFRKNPKSVASLIHQILLNGKQQTVDIIRNELSQNETLRQEVLKVFAQPGKTTGSSQAFQFFPWRMELDRKFLEEIRPTYDGHADAVLVDELLSDENKCTQPMSKI